MPTPQRTIEQKTGDAVQVFNVLRVELTEETLRNLSKQVIDVGAVLLEAIAKDPTGPSADQSLRQYASLVQDSVLLSRVVAGNDRTAMIAAAMLTQSGVSRPNFTVED